jgi:hypothetical protein
MHEEKFEKELLKHSRGSKDSDVLSGVVWAFILIWAGVILLASNMGWFEALGYDVDLTWRIQSFRDWNRFGVWNLIALGAGGIILLETAIRVLLPKFRRDIGGNLIVAAFCIGIGLGGWYSWNYLWPMMLIAIGIKALIKGASKR